MRALILLVILGTAAAIPDRVSRIVGGEPTGIETYPFVANMQYNLFNIFWVQGCGGSLITEVTVLTAAHCVKSDPPSAWRVILGTSQRSGANGSIHTLTNIIMHPEYEIVSPLDADVAILRMATRAVLSNTVQTIPIASATTELTPGLPVTAIGWGTLSYHGPSPDQLQHVEVFVVNQQLCAERYAHLKTLPGFSEWPDVTANMVCAGIVDVGGKDGCQGDSGGPVIFRAVNFNLLVGITSWGYRCGERDYPGISVRIPRFTDWIVQNAS